ncbi:MAG TPA: hypothetical protein VEI07_07935 [Planctomycetaceae bacterium]|nr:hypothetical protein [Planctomycetaceae bacterium]
MPWLHNHESLAHHDGHSENALAWHMRHFHAAGDEEDHGWHIHWTLPWNIVNCPSQHDNVPAEERASALEMPLDVTQSASVSQADADAHAGFPPAALLTADRERDPGWHSPSIVGRHLLETYLPRVSLRALFCVAQC